MKKVSFLSACACLLIFVAIRVYYKGIAELDEIKQTVVEHFNMNKDVENKYMLSMSKDTTGKILIPYKLTTQYTTIVFIDYGTFKEIDSLKPIRYKEMLAEKAKWERWEHEGDIALKKRVKDLEYLNKPCK